MKKEKKSSSRPSAREHLAQNLLMARTIWGWSQEELGLQCGLKRTYIGALERREINPGIDNLEKLASAMGVPGYVLLLEPQQAHALLYRSHNGG